MSLKKKIFVPILILFALVASALFVITSSSESDELRIEFIPLGDHGDSFVARLGDSQLLVDAGRVGESEYSDKIKTITSVIDRFMEGDAEGVWDYIIVTHSDYDHIASLATSSIEANDYGVLRHIKTKGWKIGTLIDFDITKDSTIDESEYSALTNGKAQFFQNKNLTEKETYDQYAKRRDQYYKEGVITQYFTASQCCYKARGTERVGNASSTFDFGGATIRILYNYYYDHRINPQNTKVSSAELNCLSVCFLLEYRSQKMLFTGDLEEYDSTNSFVEIGGEGSGRGGETLLYEYNKEYLKDGVDLYKAAHHGSSTSNSESFVDAIKPNRIVIPAVAGSSHHESSKYGTFPTQAVLNNFMKYTDYIYVTEYATANKQGQMLKAVDYYGAITVVSDGESTWVETEYELDESGVPLLITSTAWFKENRTSSLNVYMFDLNGEYGLGHCTLVKYGHIDILLDCGVNGRSGQITNKRIFIDDIRKYCVDGVIEYAIISCAQTDSISQMINDGIFANFIIENLVDYGNYTNFTSPVSTGWVGTYIKEREEGVKADTIKNYYPNGTVSSFTVNDRLKLSFYNLKAPVSGNENDYSICTLVEFCGKKLLFSADITENREVVLSKSANQQLKNVDLYLANNYGAESSSCSEFLSVIRPKITVITAAVGLPMNTKSSATSIDVCKNLDQYANQAGCEVYVAAQYINGKIETVCGDIKVEIIEKNGRVVVDQSNNGLIVTYNGNNNYRGIENTEWYKKASAA